jgi:parvulin-like peptidyl-prolyl isomerase
LGRTKKKRTRKSYEPTKGQLSRWEKQKRKQRIITIIGGVIITAVVLILGIGLYTQWYKPIYQPLHETVYEINEHGIKMNYFVDALEYYSGYNTDYATYLVEYTENAVKEGLLLIDSAERLGHTVEEAEIAEIIKENGLKENQAVEDIIEIGLVMNELREGYFGPQVALTTQQRSILTAFVDSEETALQFAQRYEQGEEFAALVEEYSLDTATAEDDGDLGWHSQFILEDLIGSEEFAAEAFEIEVGQFGAIEDKEKNRQLGFWLVEVLEINEENGERHIRAMLLGSETEAAGIMERIVNGEDFGDLADEYSQLDATGEGGGDLGWLAPSASSDAFNEYAFNEETAVYVLSEPVADEEVETKGGYWVILVEDEELSRLISDEDKEKYIDDLFVKWTEALKDDSANEIIDNMTDEKRAFAIEQATD